MRLDLEVLDLAVEILREEARVSSSHNESWSEHCEDVADRIADILDTLELAVTVRVNG